MAHCPRMDFPAGSVIKNPLANVGDAKDVGSILGSGRSPEVGNGKPLQCSRLENSVVREAWWATVHGVTNSQIQLSDLTELNESLHCSSEILQALLIGYVC